MSKPPQDLCSKILAADAGIRFAGVANSLGKIIASEYRKGLAPLLTQEETEKSILQSIVRMGTRQTLEEKLGKTVYAFALYEKVKRASMMLPGGNILMVSFDTNANHESIILNKILPLTK